MRASPTNAFIASVAQLRGGFILEILREKGETRKNLALRISLQLQDGRRFDPGVRGTQIGVRDRSHDRINFSDNKINYGGIFLEKDYSRRAARPRLDSAPLSVSSLSRISGRTTRVVPWAATSFEQFDGNQSSERRRAGREEARRGRSSQEGLTDTWPLNGANLRAPAVTLLIR